MIIREKPSLFQLLFAMRGSVLPRIMPRILGVSGIAAALVAIERHLPGLPHTNAAPFAVFGIALSLFLGFRNNAAYERWWEGRQLWGQLVADMRSLARDIHMFVPQVSHRHKALRTAMAFLHLHRANLRGLQKDPKALEWSETDYSNAAHPPCAALNDLTSQVSETAEDGFARKALSERIAALALSQAGCERIATTPLPYVYSLLVFRTTYLYCLMLPLGLVDSAGWMTPFFVAVVAYVFFGLAEVTEELSEPFGETVNGLPLDAMCRTIEISIAPHLDIPAPAPLKPVNYYLS